MVALEKVPCVYNLANRRHGTLFIGVTSDLPVRVFQHKASEISGYTKKYGFDQLVYYEFHDTMDVAIRREKQPKKWNGAWKIRLIMRCNPAWHDLSDEILG